MGAIKLTSQQKKAIDTHLGRFKSYLAEEPYRADQRERERRVAFFRDELPTRLPDLSEADVTELVTMLWATALWGNKQYHAQQVITENGIDKLRQELTRLLDTSRPPAKRYERFVHNVKHLGPAAVTEMSSPTVQKVIAVSDDGQLDRIRRECEGLPHEFRNALALWPVVEVQKVGEQLQAAIESINKLGLVQGF